MVPTLAVPAGATLMVLSPHLDDAVLSCGALMADAVHRGVDVLVVTAFNGRATEPLSPAAQRFHARCGLADAEAMDVREQEDDAALAAIGARTVRLQQPEALYRRRPDGTPWYGTDSAIFQPGPESLVESSPGLARLISDQVAAAAPSLVLAPAAIGGHVDHRLIARAVRFLDRPVLHYEDVPYVLYDHHRDWPRWIPVRNRQVHRSTSPSWAAKLDGIECYRSQREILWCRPGSWRDDLTAYAQAVGGDGPAEQYWTLR